MAEAKVAYSRVMAPRQIAALTAQKPDIFLYMIVVMVLLTLVSIFHVWSRVRVVDLNLQISNVMHQMKEQQQEHYRLELEAASLKTPARIEALAKGELGMALPRDQQVIVVK